ncbi:unnamed protein product (macronuclear) [Paramecium tetraurelia]|uniref:Lebercilin domain-containing protein n=1 Tax=Paramecium tetraurelia TaxID=5888 RepID=A0CYC3_PARTE|nr:uncharacterized protein GSPATT00011390001 [Paramecium tetraurelia]CAK75790.1 unnamed protein product [Paramecium tetraurelia]|eukprot:XP_001443187.1 hypothetical protein (macronuclear) [Paramecium tetraurelia strain d4-2]
MNQQSFVQVNLEHDQIKKRVNSLKFQLKDIDQKNFIIQQKLKDLRQLSPDAKKSPIAQLQEQLGLDRKQIMEQFKPIIEKEGVYVRNERLKTESYLQNSRNAEIQQKKIKVKQIEDQDSQVLRRKAEFYEKKINEIRQRQVQEMELNKLIVHKKVMEINNYKRYEQQLLGEITLAKQKEQSLNNRFCQFATSSDNSIMLPLISKTNSRMSQKSYSQQRSIMGSNSVQRSEQQLNRFQRSDTKNNNSFIDYVENKGLRTKLMKEEQNEFNIGCQTSFILTDKNQQSVQHSQNFDTYCSNNQNESFEKMQKNKQKQKSKK